MKLKSIIVVVFLGVLSLTVALFAFNGNSAQAATSNGSQQIITIAASEESELVLASNDHLWVIEGTLPENLFISCEVIYPNGQAKHYAPDGLFQMNDTTHFRFSIFPEADDWGAELRLVLSQLANPTGEQVNRKTLYETVAPQQPAERPTTGLVWLGEELPGCEIWQWQVTL
ncbi:hypothetical protein K8R78_07270 [bacterium]|nr:hypothetical protein [bacterium]